MDFLHLLILALIQGITEFLPISSSGHLILLPALTGSEDQGQFLDVAVHFGTLGAVVLYFWADVRTALLGLPRLATGKTDTPGAKLAFLLIIATIPAILFGLFLKVTGLDDMMRSMEVIGWTMLVFGIVLWWFDSRCPETKQESDWNLKEAIILGLWQCIALIPGTSRSGITITGARALGYSRHDGAKISMLMSIPIILASATLLVAEVIGEADTAAMLEGAVAAAMAFASALLALILMMRLLRTVSFLPYVIYRVVLGVILLWIVYT